MPLFTRAGAFFMHDNQNQVIRVNRFSVPSDGRDEFMARLEQTHGVIRQQSGVIDDMILEQQVATDLFSVLAIIRFEGEHVLQPTIAAIAEADQAKGIDRQGIARRLGIAADIGFYRHAGSA